MMSRRTAEECRRGLRAELPHDSRPRHRSYTLTDAQVGSHYAMRVSDYWGPKPYSRRWKCRSSRTRLRCNCSSTTSARRDPDDLPSSAVEQYLNNSKYSHYSLPTMIGGLPLHQSDQGPDEGPGHRTAGDARHRRRPSRQANILPAEARSRAQMYRPTCFPRSTQSRL